MIKKRVYAFVLTPILFMACANTEPKQEEVKAKVETAVEKRVETVTPVAVQTEVLNARVPEPAPIPATAVATKAQDTVSFIENKKVLEDGMMHINAFIGSLQPTLKGLLEEDSTHLTAMGACKTIAPDLINDYNKQISGTKLRRTAIKYRNPKNKPDRADTMVMDEFVEKKSFKPIVVELDNQYRVYKPLKIKYACLLCHGARNDISPELVKMIDRNYPKDRATGFQLGEFRGVVVAEIQK